MSNSANIISREQFMNFFRDDKLLNQLSADDRIEVFSQILTGNSDITKKLLESLLSDYQVENLIIVEKEYDKK